jgi:hypothetical protein
MNPTVTDVSCAACRSCRSRRANVNKLLVLTRMTRTNLLLGADENFARDMCPNLDAEPRAVQVVATPSLYGFWSQVRATHPSYLLFQR